MNKVPSIGVNDHALVDDDDDDDEDAGKNRTHTFTNLIPLSSSMRVGS